MANPIHNLIAPHRFDPNSASRRTGSLKRGYNWGIAISRMAFHSNKSSRLLARVSNACPPLTHSLLIASLLLILGTTLHAQSDIIIQDVVMGKADVTATNSITLKPGFKAIEGSNFRASIASTAQAQNSSAIISSPAKSVTPAAGSTDQNYIKAITYREAQTSVPTGSLSFQNTEDIQYFDGLGRPMQTVHVGASPSGNDIIQPTVYDSLGREAIKTLPYTATKSGAFRTGVTEATVDSYYGTSTSTPVGITPDSRAYTQIIFDNSPLNRPVSQTGPGNEWATHAKSVISNYLSNTVAQPGWTVTGDYSYSSFSYVVNTLYVTETTDEQGNITREYKDKLGQVVLKESKLGTDWLQTRYIYDDFGLLRCVVPPEATDPNTDTQLCYYYLYDIRHRMKEKIIPGGGVIKMIYDNRDRLRYTKSSLQASLEWTYIKYDELNRPIISGILTGYTASAAATLETATNAAALNETRSNSATNGYTNVSFPTTNTTVLSVTYYDNYDFFNINGIGINDSLKSITYNSGAYNFQSTAAISPKGRVTGTMTMVLSSSQDAAAVPKNKLYSTMYYDKYGHTLRTISENHLGGKDIVSNLYEDITYQVTQSRQEHFKGAEHITLDKTFEYDQTGRLLATREKINSQSEFTLNAMQYNEVGELITKYMHSNQTGGARSFIQKEDYFYNIRGWLTQINDPSLSGDNDLFGMQIFYNNTSGMGSLAPSQGIYNGNIAGMTWNIKNDVKRGYQFSYDGLNRLLQANYAEGASLGTNAGYYSESISSYDKNGNILGLQRKYNNTLVDDLAYTYTTTSNVKTNQLQRLVDNGTSSSGVEDYPGSPNGNTFTYDTNGNMNNDGAKNFTVNYHPTLNLPQTLDFGSNNRIFYHYTASGAKLLKHVKPASSSESYTHYIGNIVYNGGTLAYILTEEGRLVATGTGSDRTFAYEYNLKDHLGNTRVTFMGTDLGGAVDVVQSTNYYPFGLVMNQFKGNTATGYQKNKYLYNGKELQDDKMTCEALNWYDYGARFYDPQIGRFTTQDPLAETTNSVTPYHYCLNNPMSNIDPTGMWTETPTSYTTSDPNEIAEFLNQNQHVGDPPPEKKGKNLPTTMRGVANHIVDELTPGLPTLSSPEEMARKDESISRTTTGVNTASVGIIVNVGLFFVSEGVGYLMSKVGGAITLRILSRAELKALEASGASAEGAAWAQKTFGGTFSAGGKFAGQTVDEVAAALGNGTLSASEVPINVVVRNGQTFILNTRSSVALIKGGIPRSAWTIIDRTGVSSFEEMLSGQLGRNGLINGTNSIRQSGTQVILTH